MVRKDFVNTNGKTVARVTFTLPDSLWADEIYLVGDFNNWNDSSHPMQQDHRGDWTLTVDLEMGRAYQFRYRRDGGWINECEADAYVYNRYGGGNFVVVTDPGLELVHA
jgi:1,4-alpha-glucan branching enzyme